MSMLRETQGHVHLSSTETAGVRGEGLAHASWLHSMRSDLRTAFDFYDYSFKRLSNVICDKFFCDTLHTTTT
jgi:hypothetical protein